MVWRVKDYEEYEHERSAIYQFDGGLSEEEANRRAEQDKQKLIEEHLRQKSEEVKRV